MRYFLDTGFLILYALLSAFFVPVDYWFTLAFLCTLILVCSCNFLPSAYVRTGMGLVFFAAALFIPAFFLFYPAAVYTLLRDRRYILSVLAVLLFYGHFLSAGQPDFILLSSAGLAFLLAALLRHNTTHLELLENEFRRMQDDSREKNLLLSEKNKSILEKQDYEIYTATLKERNRIAREIHDNVGHLLSRSILMVGALKAVSRDETTAPLLSDLDSSLNSAMDSIRSSVHDLHNESVNLEESIGSLIHDFTFCPVDLQYDMSVTVPREIKYCFISITKEALSNIIKHSNASHVQIIMREHPALYQLRIEDNGTVDKSLPSKSGIGLSNMRDRVSALHGTLQFLTEKGFRIFITVPKGDSI